MTKDTFYLRKSTRKDKKWSMEMPSYGHTHHFGAKGMRDRTLIKNPAERMKAWKSYQARHRKDPIGDVHSPAALSWYLLWSADTLSQGIKNYERKFNVKVVKK